MTISHSLRRASNALTSTCLDTNGHFTAIFSAWLALKGLYQCPTHLVLWPACQRVWVLGELIKSDLFGCLSVGHSSQSPCSLALAQSCLQVIWALWRCKVTARVSIVIQPSVWYKVCLLHVCSRLHWWSTTNTVCTLSAVKNCYHSVSTRVCSHDYPDNVNSLLSISCEHFISATCSSDSYSDRNEELHDTSHCNVRGWSKLKKRVYWTHKRWPFGLD